MSVATPTTPVMLPSRSRTGEYWASNSKPNSSTRAVTDSPASARRTSVTACGTSPSSSKNDLPSSIPERFHHRPEVVGVHDLDRVATQQLVGAIAEQPLHRRAHIPQDSVVPQDGDDVGGIFRQRAEVLLALAQRVLDARALERGREHVGERLDEQ